MSTDGWKADMDKFAFLLDREKLEREQMQQEIRDLRAAFAGVQQVGGGCDAATGNMLDSRVEIALARFMDDPLFSQFKSLEHVAAETAKAEARVSELSATAENLAGSIKAMQHQVDAMRCTKQDWEREGGAARDRERAREAEWEKLLRQASQDAAERLGSLGDPTVLDATIAKSMESVRASLANEFRHDKCQDECRTRHERLEALVAALKIEVHEVDSALEDKEAVAESQAADARTTKKRIAVLEGKLAECVSALQGARVGPMSHLDESKGFAHESTFLKDIKMLQQTAKTHSNEMQVVLKTLAKIEGALAGKLSKKEAVTRSQGDEALIRSLAQQAAQKTDTDLTALRSYTETAFAEAMSLIRTLKLAISTLSTALTLKADQKAVDDLRHALKRKVEAAPTAPALPSLSLRGEASEPERSFRPSKLGDGGGRASIATFGVVGGTPKKNPVGDMHVIPAGFSSSGAQTDRGPSRPHQVGGSRKGCQMVNVRGKIVRNDSVHYSQREATRISGGLSGESVRAVSLTSSDGDIRAEPLRDEREKVGGKCIPLASRPLAPIAVESERQASKAEFAADRQPQHAEAVLGVAGQVRVKAKERITKNKEAAKVVNSSGRGDESGGSAGDQARPITTVMECEKAKTTGVLEERGDEVDPRGGAEGQTFTFVDLFQTPRETRRPDAGFEKSTKSTAQAGYPRPASPWQFSRRQSAASTTSDDGPRPSRQNLSRAGI